MKKVYFFLIVAASSCTSSKQIVTNNSAKDDLIPHGKLFSSLFIQQAAEYKALCFQAYNIAAYRLTEALNDPNIKKPLAVVADIDETVFDNSPYAVAQALKGKDFDPESWYSDWTSKGIADTMAGAASFFKFAASQNVAVFYITNREERERMPTIQNLKKYGLPYADVAHVLTKTNTSDKEPRRQQILASYHIALLIGDNLTDFNMAFNKKMSDERSRLTQSMASEFGKRYIVLPNPSYGDWETALYQYKYTLSPAQKDSVIKAVLKGY